MGLFGSIVGGLMGMKPPKAPAIDAGFDATTKARLRAEAEKGAKPLTDYTQAPSYQDMRGGNSREPFAMITGATPDAQRTADINKRYQELAAAEAAKPVATPATTAPPTMQDAQQISRTRLVTPSSRADSRKVGSSQVLAQLARRSMGRASNVIGG